jgi:urease accessory protein
MHKFIRNLGQIEVPAPPQVLQAVLPIDLRIKSRVRITLDNGDEAGLFLPRGQLIRGGDVLESEQGKRIEILAANELVSTVVAKDAFALMKAAYHLGNRHVPLELTSGYLRYIHDKVLDDMIRGMGLAVSVDFHPFEPEEGAYKQLGHHSHG